MAEVSLALLGMLGLAIALFFTLITYGRTAPRTALIAVVCRLDTPTCQRVVHTPQARLLGLPNSVYGMAYYALLLLGLALGWWRPGALLLGAAVVVAWATVALGAYLLYALLVVLRVSCPLCLLSHALNLVLALLLGGRWGGLV